MTKVEFLGETFSIGSTVSQVFGALNERLTGIKYEGFTPSTENLYRGLTPKEMVAQFVSVQGNNNLQILASRVKDFYGRPDELITSTEISDYNMLLEEISSHLKTK